MEEHCGQNTDAIGFAGLTPVVEIVFKNPGMSKDRRQGVPGEDTYDVENCFYLQSHDFIMSICYVSKKVYDCSELDSFSP